MDILEISEFKIAGQKFAGRRANPSTDHSNWDTIIPIFE